MLAQHKFSKTPLSPGLPSAACHRAGSTVRTGYLLAGGIPLLPGLTGSAKVAYRTQAKANALAKNDVCPAYPTLAALDEGYQVRVGERPRTDDWPPTLLPTVLTPSADFTKVRSWYWGELRSAAATDFSTAHFSSTPSAPTSATIVVPRRYHGGAGSPCPHARRTRPRRRGPGRGPSTARRCR